MQNDRRKTVAKDQHHLCAPGDIPESCARSFAGATGMQTWDVLVHRTGDTCRAYVNACPHTGTPLETFPDKLMTSDGVYLLCSTHGARFRPEDGLCVSGPWKGQNLIPVRLEVDRDAVRLSTSSQRKN